MAGEANTTDHEGSERSGYDDSACLSVDVPHNWGYEGAHRLRHGHRHARYWCEFAVPESERGRRLFLFFEGVGAFATAWVNSKSAGQHAGGRTAFTLDVTGFGSARFSYPPPDFWRTESNKDACEDSPLSAPLRARPPTSAPPLPTRLAFPAP